MAPNRRQQISERLADSGFVRKVVGPKVLEPVTNWYQDKVAVDHPDEPGPDPTPTHETETTDLQPPGEAISAPPDPVPVPSAPRASSSLASARTAEAFFAGPDAGEEPQPRPAIPPTISAPTPASEPELISRFGRVKRVALSVKDRMGLHNLNVVAAGVAFWALLAIPAVLTAIVSIYGMVASPEDVESQIESALSGTSPELQDLVSGQLSDVAGASGGGLALGAIAGILLAVWTTSGAVAKVIATLNTIWGATENRGFLKLRGLAIGVTFGAVVVIAGAAFLLAVLPAVLGQAGLGDAARWLLNIARFPLLLAVMAVGLSVLYSVGPNRRRPLRLISWGAAWATVLWLVVSGLFSIYTASFASYNETYGSLGAIVVALLWLYITAFMVLVGAEIDAIRDEQAAPT